MNSRVKEWLKIFALLGILYFPLFGQLNSFPLILFDESRQAMNALEMHEHGNWFIPHYQGNPDLLNAKPPFLIWTQVLLMNIIGENELAVRLPSAIAGLLTIILVFAFCNYYLKKFWTGLFSALVLVTSQGYVAAHVTRTGDYDAMVTLFLTFSILSFFIFIQTKRNFYLHLFFISITMAAMTKGITTFLFAPAFLIFLVISKQLLSLFRNWHFYSGVAYTLLIIFSYYLIRDHYNPGYIQSVLNNEVGGRYLIEQYNHYRGFWFYFERIRTFCMGDWFIFLIPSILFGIFQRNLMHQNFMIFLSICIVTLYMVLGFAKTQCEWYIVPLLPLFALTIGFFLEFLMETITSLDFTKKNISITTASMVFLIFIFFSPYMDTCRRTIVSNEFLWSKQNNSMGVLLKSSNEGRFDLKGVDVLYDGIPTHLEFYISLLNKKGNDIKLKEFKDLSPGDSIMVSQQHLKESIERTYFYTRIKEDWDNIVFLHLGAKKNHASGSIK
jgi:4-amino-4-deoxy-L-arabinose transferase-like glycosyltransferase